ncbi:MAG: type 1 glutamine amidotransferase [Bacteroidetes bacterium]|nr:type 1 glutamine amidotransferase [Bacteroidota bacterium]
MALRVLLIDNYDSFTFNLVQLLEESGNCLVDVVKNDSIDLSRGSEYDKVLLSPGPGIPREAGHLLEFLQIASPTCSILGISLGQQAIAEFFGGSLLRTPEVVHGVTKEVILNVSDDPLFRGMPERFPAGLYHSWAVNPASLPPSLRVTAQSVDGVIMAIAHTSRDVRGIQFHPESVMTPIGSALIRNWLLM